MNSDKYSVRIFSRSAFLIVLGIFASGVMLTGCSGTTRSAVCVLPGDDLQAVLDSGDDLLLRKGAVYEIKETLTYKFPHQKISTKDAVHISDYATLRITNPDLMQLMDADRQNYVRLERVLLDGNRYRISTVPKFGPGGGGQPAMVLFGGDGAVGQQVVNNVFMSTRTWSTLKVHEGAVDTLVEGNIFLGAGVGPRGNGREKDEKPFSWGDGISCASRRSVIRNNLIIDPTDVGVVLYGAPGSIVTDNVVASISRESLGGINMVDPLAYYALNEEETLFDYRGVIIENNYIDAFGSRIHIAFPMGSPGWVPHLKGKVLVGATVRGNTVAGNAAAYGFIANGVEDFTITGNKSTATYSGLAEGLGPDNPPDDPGPFLYDPEDTKNCTLQKEFKPCQKHLLHVLRCNHGKTNELGYRIYPYGDEEVKAVVKAAYVEMLGRDCTPKELEDNVNWLQETKSTSDELRRDLMASDEFKRKFGSVDSDDLHLYRINLWMANIDRIRRDYMREHNEMPKAIDTYIAALGKLYR